MYNVEQFNSKACFLYFFPPRYCNKVAKAVYTLIAALIHGTRDTFRKTFREIVLVVQNLF